jgi:hypothetical protein
MALDTAYAEFGGMLDLLSQHIRGFAATRPPISSVQPSLLDECLLEGLISRAWQAWSNFCRNCVVESCIGTVDSRGRVISGLPQATTEEHVSGAAIRANQKRNLAPYWGQPNAVLRAEPTWGDADVILRVLTRLRPSNVGQLLAAFSSSHSSAKAIQRIRNGAAHNHNQNLSEIQGMRSAYLAFPITHATHAMFWIEPRSGDFLITHAMNELRDAGLAAIS